MWEVVAFSNPNEANKTQLAQDIDAQIENSQVEQAVEKTHNIIVKMFPSFFFTPGELVEYFEELREKWDNPWKFNEKKALLDQNYSQAPQVANNNSIPLIEKAA